jgi:phage baseplate assembly protein W
MAVILGKKLVSDTKDYNDYAVGITLPIQIGNTAFNQSFTVAEQVKSNIKNLLLTKKYERVMQPELGSGLQELLFEFNDDDLSGNIEDTIVSALSLWLPYVTVDSIIIEQNNELRDMNSINVSIRFKILNRPSLETVTFKVKT